MLMLSFCGISICHIMGNMIRVDATLRLGHKVILKGHQCSCLIDLRFPANLTLKVRCFLFIYYLQQKYFEPVFIDLHNNEHIITYT